MKVRVSQQEEIKATYEDGEDSFDVVFRAPTAMDILNFQDNIQNGQSEALMELLCSLFVRFDGDVEFIDQDNNIIEVNDFRHLLNLGGSDVMKLSALSIEKLTNYLYEADKVEKK